MNPIPERYRLVLVSGAVGPTEAMKAVQASFGDVLVLSGGIGTGKTLAACWWAEKGAKPGTPFPGSVFMTAAELARWPRYDMAKMSALLERPHLVIDDLGTEYMDDKGNFMAVLDEVIGTRCANMRRTVITTNLSAKGFRERYGARITDRIVECGRFVSIAGDSLRKPENQPAIEATRDDETERKQAEYVAKRAAERRTCELHLYGPGPYGRECNAKCPSWKVQLTEPSDIRAAIEELAKAKAIQPEEPTP